MSTKNFQRSRSGSFLRGFAAAIVAVASCALGSNAFGDRSDAAFELDVSSAARSGDGRPESPWAGWELALNQLPEYGRAKFRPGNYAQREAIRAKSGWWLSGEGRTSKIRLADASNTSMLVNADEAKPVRDVKVENLALDGNKSGQKKMSHLIALRAAARSLYRNLYLRDPSGDCIIHSRDTSGNVPREWVIRDVRCEGFGRNGISVTESSSFLIEGAYLANSDPHADPGAGIDVEVNDRSSLIADGVIRSVIAEGNAGSGIALIGGSSGSGVQRTLIDRCILEKNSQSGLHLYFASGTTLQNCRIVGNGGDGILLSGGAKFNYFREAMIRDNRGAGLREQAEGIFFAPNYNFVMRSELQANLNGAAIFVGERSRAYGAPLAP